MNEEDKFVVEWSPTQKVFHVQSLEASLQSNRIAMKEGRRIDFILVALTDTKDEAHAVADAMRPYAHGYVPIPFA